MKQIIVCRICEYSGRESDEYPCETCRHYENFKKKKQLTNADKIRSMSDGELAEFFARKSPCNYYCNYSTRACNGVSCKQGILEWLKSPTTD